MTQIKKTKKTINLKDGSTKDVTMYYVTNGNAKVYVRPLDSKDYKSWSILNAIVDNE